MKIRIIKYKIKRNNITGYFVAFCSAETGAKIGKTMRSILLPNRGYFIKTTYNFLKELSDYSDNEKWYPVVSSGVYTNAADYYIPSRCYVLEDSIIELKEPNEWIHLLIG